MLWEYDVRFIFDPVAMLTIIFLLYMKSTDDILQGISKLDYLLKVSIFQIYKDPKLREEQLRGFTICSTGSDVGLKDSRFDKRKSL